MSDAVSAVKGAAFEGPAASVRDLGPTGMITIRGDFSNNDFAAAIRATLGADIPGVRRMEKAKDGSLGWMSPDELLYVTDYASAPAAEAALREALAGQHFLVANVSDARAVFHVTGEGARELIASGAPVDLSDGAFAKGDLRRTRLGQVAVAFWLCENGGFHLVCFRSVGVYVYDWLTTAAKSGVRPGLF